MATPVFNKAFEYIAERVNTINSEEFTLEPKTTSNQAVTLELEQLSSNVLAFWDDVRTFLSIT